MPGWDVNPWRDMSTAALFREQECRRFDLADIDGHPDGWNFAPESRDFLAFTISELETELARRKRLAGTHGAPAMPTVRDRKSELEEIKRRVSVVDLIHSVMFREYQRRGRNDVWCCCPLHDESTASFHIDEARQIWHCFGCGLGGDVFELGRHLWGEGEFFRVADRLRELAGMGKLLPLPPARPGMTRADGTVAHVSIPQRQPRAWRR